MFRLFWLLYLKLTGWDTNVRFPSNIKKAVLIVGPHTSSWDFIMGLAYRSVSRVENGHFLGKAELFKPPFGWWFRWLGGTPVERKSSHNVVEQVTEIFNQHDEFVLALSPEGTRSKVEQLKTGFYHIAKSANVPIVMAGMDFGNKTLLYSEPFYPSNDEAADFIKIINFFGPIKGKRPELGLMHLLPESDKI